MASSEMNNLYSRINTKILTAKKYLQLRTLDQELPLRSMVNRVRLKMEYVCDLLNIMEREVQEQEKLKDSLQELLKAAKRDECEAQHLHENMPLDLLKPTLSCVLAVRAKHKEQPNAAKPECAKQPPKEAKFIKEATLITVEEFGNVPAYMKGRLTCEQVNTVIQELNKAVVAKYKILRQPLKSMNAGTRNIYRRFLEEESKHTIGEFFVVEADIKLFTSLRVDKRFYNILNIMRHCHRVREVRGSSLIRYVIC